MAILPFVQIRTTEYRVEQAELKSAMIRSCYRGLRFFVLVEVVVGIALLALSIFTSNMGNVIIGIFLVLSGISTPYLQAIVAIRNSLKSPLFDRSFVTEFTDSHLLQTSGDAVESKFAYEMATKALEIPEGFQIYMTRRNWALIPARVFASEADREAVRGLLRQKGLLKRG